MRLGRCLGLEEGAGRGGIGGRGSKQSQQHRRGEDGRVTRHVVNCVKARLGMCDEVGRGNECVKMGTSVTSDKVCRHLNSTRNRELAARTISKNGSRQRPARSGGSNGSCVTAGGSLCGENQESGRVTAAHRLFQAADRERVGACKGRHRGEIKETVVRAPSHALCDLAVSFPPTVVFWGLTRLFFCGVFLCGM